MDTQNVLKSSQEQGFAAWIDYLRILKIESLLDKLSAQDCNLEKALTALEQIKVFLSEPSHILGSPITKHGEVAEHMQVDFSNAEAAVNGNEQLYTFDGVGRLAMEDYLRNGNMVQSKFYNGTKGTFRAIREHLNDYPNFIKDGGTYDIPQDQYKNLLDIYDRGEHARSSLIRSEETLFKEIKHWEADNSFQLKDVVKPAIVKYDEVQLNVANQTISREESHIRKIDKDIRQKAIAESKPTLAEGTKATLIGASLEGGTAFALKIYQKKKAGKKIQNFTAEDWKDVGLGTLIGTGKGAVRGAIVYAATNHTSVPSPITNAMITATFGVVAQARKFEKKDITKEEFIDNCEVICLDVAISAISSVLGNTFIPIPVLGTIIGNAVGMFMYEISKDYLTSIEQRITKKYQEDFFLFVQNLDAEYQNAVNTLDNKLCQFNSLLFLVFNNDSNKSFMVSAMLATSVGAEKQKILKNKEERDSFFG